MKGRMKPKESRANTTTTMMTSAPAATMAQPRLAVIDAGRAEEAGTAEDLIVMRASGSAGWRRIWRLPDQALRPSSASAPIALWLAALHRLHRRFMLCIIKDGGRHRAVAAEPVWMTIRRGRFDT